VTALDARIIERKLEFMRRALLQMERVVAEGEAAYLTSEVAQAVLERQVERLVEAAVDAASHVLREQFQVSPSTYREALLELGRRGVIEAELAERLAPAAGLRNFITHQYDEIDPRRVFAGAGAALAAFPPYMAALRRVVGCA
jgi:uncharacterized protein YutE (UPF0331/DUF86 family)